MAKRLPRLYAIGLQRPLTRRVLKILILPLPIFIIALRSQFNPVSENNPLEHLLFALLAVPLAWTMFWLVAKKLYISSHTLRFGLLHAYKSTELLEIDTERNAEHGDVINLLFQRQEKTKKETIRIANLKESNKEKLLHAIEQFAPAAKVSSSARALLIGQSHRHGVFKPGEKVALAYNTRPLLGQLSQMMAGYQNYFWLAWIITNTALIIFFYIIFALVPYFARADFAAAKLVIGPIIESILRVLTSVGSVASLGSSDVVGIISIVLTTAIGTLALPHLLGANKLTLDTEKISLLFEGFGFKRIISEIKWSDIDQISVLQSIGARNKTDNVIEFSTKSTGATKLSLDLNALGDFAQRLILSQAIEKYAPHVKIDAAAITTLRMAADASYTDIWLSGLAKAPHSTALVPLITGDKIGDNRYEIINRFMLGGQSTVYLASSSSPQNNDTKQLIVKETILPIFDNHDKTQQQIKRFQAEAEFLRRLQHPGLVQVVDSFVEGTRGFIIMEKIEGSSLKSLVENRGAMDREKVNNLAAQMCEILSYLHSQSVIHRDFTPDNLILSDEGKLILIDLGVAQNTAEHITSAVVGKHGYMPPEQFRGQATERSDLYAMGCTLYFLLTGAEPTPLTKLNLADTTSGATNLTATADNLALLIHQLTDFEEKNRPASADQALQMLMNSESDSVAESIRITHLEREQELG